MPAKPKPYVLPKTLGACADALYLCRQERLAAGKVVEGLEEREKLLKEHIINTLPKSQAGGISGKVGKVTLGHKQVPKVEDWDKFYAHIKKTGNFALLQRRPADAAIGEVWDNRKTVPGVVPFGVVTLSVTKA